MFKKLICLMLVLATVLVFAACNNNDRPDVSDTDDETTAESNKEVVTEDPGPQFELPDTDWDGREFVMLCRQARMQHFWNDGESTVQLDQAVFDRNSFVEEQYDIFITCIPVGDSAANFNSMLTASAMSGCKEYDAVSPDYWWQTDNQGFFTNLYDLDYLNLDAPWWWSAWNECYSFNNRRYRAYGRKR